MYCLPIDDACWLQAWYENTQAQIRQQLADEQADNAAGIDIGTLNGRVYSMITVDGKPIIVIEDAESDENRNTQFLGLD
jgi:hypothetical protein